MPNQNGVIFKDPNLNRVFMGVVVILIYGGASGSKPILDNFARAQLRVHEARSGPEIKHDRLKARFKVWRIVAWLLALALLFPTSDLGWDKLFIVSVSLLAFSCAGFLSGASSYHTIDPVLNPLSVVNRVVRSAISKRHFEYPNSSDGFFQSPFVSTSYHDTFFHQGNENELYLLPHVRFCRWADRAAIREPPSLVSPEQHETMCRTVTRVYDTKHVLALVPVWVALLGFGVARATCNSFFVVQAGNLSNGRDIILPTLLVINTVAKESVSYLWDFILEWLDLSLTIQRRYNFLKARIVLGTFLIVVSLYEAQLVDDKETMLLSLFPQFCLSGIAEGLALDGLADFHNYRVPASMRGYGDALNGLLKGLGNLLSIPCLIIFRASSFAGESFDSSDLPLYYSKIAVLSLISYVAAYVLLGFGYAYDSVIAENGLLDSGAFFMEDVSEQERRLYGQVLAPFHIDPDNRRPNSELEMV